MQPPKSLLEQNCPHPAIRPKDINYLLTRWYFFYLSQSHKRL